MSLRQRGQRPSEATNQGGYYTGGGVGGGGGDQQQYNNATTGNNGHPSTPHQQQQPRRPSPPSSGGSGYYGYNAATTAATSAATPIGGGGGGYAGYHQQAATPVNQQPVHQSAGYPNTAPPAYNQGGYGQPTAGAGMPARAINFDGSAGYARSGSGGTSGYGGYNAASSAGGMSNSLGSSGGSTSNPYQKSKSSSSGFGFRHVLLSLLFLTLIVLTGTTYHYRGIMKEVEADLDRAKRRAERREGRNNGRDWRGNRAKNTKSSPDDELNEEQEDDTEEELEEEEGGGSGSRAKTDKDRAKTKKKRERPPKPDRNLSFEEKELQEKQNFLNDIEEFQAKIDETTTLHQQAMERHEPLSLTLDELQGKKQDLLKSIDHTSFLLEDKAEEINKYKAMVDGREEVEEYMKKREGALWKRIEALETRIGRESWREAEEWFGPGPHKVELLIEYPKVTDPNAHFSTWPRIRNMLTIELAPLDLMPHTVNLFLQQVHHGLWDGCSVKSNPHHIIQFGPSYEEEDKDGGGDPHYDHFHEKGLDKISYQEYSENYKHAQWTVGLAGRPGGPDFYINKLDNTLIHGPGGQTNEDDLHNEADPCFGRVIMDDGSEDENNDGAALNGKTVLDQIARIPTDPQRGFEIKYPVVIIDAKVLAQKENPVDGWREIPQGTKLDQQDDILPLPEIPHGV